MSDRLYIEVIVGSDGSDTAERAVQAASRMAHALGVPVTVATAWRRDPPDGPVRSEEASYPGGGASGAEAMWAKTTVADGAGIARATGCEDVRTATPEGAPAEAILALAEERPGSLLVVGTIGIDHRAERLMGNVPHQLTHHSPRDLLLVRSDDQPHGWDRIALATDGSATASLAVERGRGVAAALDVVPTLLTVARDEEQGRSLLDEVADETGLPDAEHEVAVGKHVSEALTEAAGAFDLLVLGNKGMSGPSRLLGSVANRVTHEAPTDLLLVNTTR